MEREFRSLLLFSLEECASGEWGLFGQNDHCVPQLSPAEPTRLQELAQEIQSIRAESGERNDLCEQFLYLSSLRGSNVAGEPKLAATFLSEIGEGKYS
jgi:hypothetical protein